MKNTSKAIVVLIVLSFLTSCVGNRKTVLLQDNPEQHSSHKNYHESGQALNSRPVFLLQSGDVIHVKFEGVSFSEELLQSPGMMTQMAPNQVRNPYIFGYQIDSIGRIQFPVLGSVQAAGLSVDELRSELRTKLKDYYPSSSVEVFQLNATITIMGEVNSPGRYDYYKESTSIFDALAMAGDFGTYADRSHVKLLRSINGSNEVVVLNLNDVQTLGSEYLYLRNNDVLIVPPLRRNRFVTANVGWITSSVTAAVAALSLIISITSRGN